MLKRYELQQPEGGVFSRIGTAAAIAAGVLALWTVLFTVTSVFRLHVPLPAWDEWVPVMDFRAYRNGTYGWANLAGQHNEHRLLFPRLFFFADFLLFHLSGYFTIAVSILLQAANAAILIHLSRRIEPRGAMRAVLAAFVVQMLFTLRQEQNFSTGFQLQFVGVFTAAALSSMAFVQAVERIRGNRARAWLWFALAVLGCFVSAYTMANGVMAGFTLVGLGIVLRAPLRLIAATAVAAGAIACLFFWGYEKGGDSWPLSYALSHPLPYLHFLAAYLGNPLGSNIRWTQALGTFGLLGFCAALWRTASGRDRSPAKAVLLGISAFILATAAATAYGRIALGTSQAFESRYATPSLIFWTAQVLFWAPLLRRPEVPWIWRGALAGTLVILSGSAVYFEATTWPGMEAQSARFRQFSDSLLSGLYDPVASDYENIPADDIRSVLPFLREEQLSAFDSTEARALGRPMAEQGTTTDPRSCTGWISAQVEAGLGPNGTRTSGEAWNTEGDQAVRRIYVVDQAGKIVGFGSATEPVEPVREWVGYAQAVAGEDLRAYARLSRRRFCEIGTTTVAPPGG